VACVSKAYQESWACNFELKEARKMNKTVIIVVVEAGFFPRKVGDVSTEHNCIYY